MAISVMCESCGHDCAAESNEAMPDVVACGDWCPKGCLDVERSGLKIGDKGEWYAVVLEKVEE